jgi:hypothetical protein
VIDGETPEMVEFQIQRVSAYQIDPRRPYLPPQGAAPIKVNFERTIDER